MGRLMKQMIRKKMELAQDFEVRGFYFRHIWNFYSSIQMANSILERRSYEEKRKNFIFKRLLKHSEPLSSKKFKILTRLMYDESSLPSMAIQKIDDDLSKSGDLIGDLYKVGTVGILSYEWNEEY